MKKLTMPEKVYLEELDIHIKPHLTLEEIENIAGFCLQYNLTTERSYAKAKMIFKYCVGEDLSVEDYELLVANDKLQAIYYFVKAYNIDECISKMESMETTTKLFMSGILDSVEKFLKDTDTFLTKVEKKVPKQSEWKGIVSTISDKVKGLQK